MKPIGLTPEERKAMGQDQFAEYKLSPISSRVCPRCGKGWVAPHSELPCTACELEALRARVKELEELVELVSGLSLKEVEGEDD